MHDAVTFEKAGKPAVGICTQPFVPSGDAIAKIRGIPGYRFAVIQHPVGSLEPEDVDARARHALPQVLELLLAR